MPDDVTADQLDRSVRARLRTLSRDNADGVARHLVMAGRLIDVDPEEAYRHAQAAVARAGRVDVVREAAALTAYGTGRYAEALRELRTVRRLNGSDEHLPLMADCERGLGRPERAIALANEEAARGLPADGQVELAIVVSGARLDLDDPKAAVAALRVPVVQAAQGEQRLRVAEALANALEAAGDEAGAARLRAALPADVEEEAVVVYDLEDENEDEDGALEEADGTVPGGGTALREPSDGAADAAGDDAGLPSGQGQP